MAQAKRLIESEAQSKARAPKASDRSAQANKQLARSGKELREALDQAILDRHPGLTQEQLDDFMNEA